MNVGRDAGDINTGPQFHFPALPGLRLLIVLAVIAVFVVLLPPMFNYLTTREISNADQVRACMAQHQMNSAHDENEVETPGDTYLGEEVYRRTTFQFCDWPRPSYAEADGYSEIAVIMTPGPGDDEASGANALDRISTTCPAISAVYQYGSQGASEFVGPYTLRPGDVVNAFTGEDWVEATEAADPLVVYPYPRSDEVVVVHNFKIVLDKASCELSDATPRPYDADG